MKKAIKIISIIMLLVLVSSCSAKTEDLSKYNIDRISTMNIEFFLFNNLDEMYEAADYVVIASPVDTIDNSVRHLIDWSGKQTENFDDTDYAFSYSGRKCKVHKVLKGENKDLKEITLRESYIINGNNLKILDSEYIAEVNNKYLLFLKESDVKNEMYCNTVCQGKYSLNDEENKNNKHIDQKLYEQVKQAYKDQIK